MLIEQPHHQGRTFWRLNIGFQDFLLFQPRDAQVIPGQGKGRVLVEGLAVQGDRLFRALAARV